MNENTWFHAKLKIENVEHKNLDISSDCNKFDASVADV